MANNVTYLNKSCVKAIFSADSTLNVLPIDMGENMISVALLNPPAEILKTATGIMPSANINCEAEIAISVLRTAPVAKNFMKVISANSIIGGSLTVNDDDNNAYTIEKVVIKEPDLPAFNGTDPSVTLKFGGEYRVNKDIAII